MHAQSSRLAGFGAGVRTGRNCTTLMGSAKRENSEAAMMRPCTRVFTCARMLKMVCAQGSGFRAGAPVLIKCATDAQLGAGPTCVCRCGSQCCLARARMCMLALLSGPRGSSGAQQSAGQVLHARDIPKAAHLAEDVAAGEAGAGEATDQVGPACAASARLSRAQRSAAWDPRSASSLSSVAMLYWCSCQGCIQRRCERTHSLQRMFRPAGQASTSLDARPIKAGPGCSTLMATRNTWRAPKVCVELC